MNNPKKFEVKKEKYEGSPIIYLSYYPPDYIDRNNTFCLYPTSDISIFYISESKINQNFYKGKTIIYIFNNDSDIINLDNLFIINENETYIFDINTVSFKIINITNKKGNLYNEDEQLFENSFFNAKNNYIIHKRITDEGYLMIIKIVTKPRNQKNTNTTTCEVEAEIHLYVSSKNPEPATLLFLSYSASLYLFITNTSCKIPFLLIFLIVESKANSSEKQGCIFSSSEHKNCFRRFPAR
jgi:hypothetical protein